MSIPCRHTTLAAMLLAGIALLPAMSAAGGPMDGVFVQSAPARDAPSYDSDFAAESRLRGVGDATPEADARPGEYYFLEGARAYRKKDYTHAIEMYQVAASWAFKPAEYNLGVMYARGEGVAVDLPRAMAWMALAAERDEPHYVEAREAVYAEMTKEQFAEANVIWRELKKTYGDDVALRRAKARWAEVKSGMTGSRVGFVGNLTVGVPEPGSGPSKGPKIIVPAGPGADEAKQRSAHSEGSHAGPTMAGEVLGGTGVDGTIAYKQLRQSANPYDPKFEQSALGRATVGPPETLKPGATDKEATPDPADPTQHQQ